MASGKNAQLKILLLILLIEFSLNIAKKLLSGAIFIDLKKAFDAVKPLNLVAET